MSDYLDNEDVSWENVCSFIEVSCEVLKMINSEEIDFMQIEGGKDMKAQLMNVCVQVIAAGMNTIQGIRASE